MALDDKVRAYLRDLGAALNEAVSSSEKVHEILAKVKAEGYGVYLVLDATVALEKRGRRSSAALPSIRRGALQTARGAGDHRSEGEGRGLRRLSRPPPHRRARETRAALVGGPPVHSTRRAPDGPWRRGRRRRYRRDGRLPDQRQGLELSALGRDRPHAADPRAPPPGGDRHPPLHGREEKLEGSAGIEDPSIRCRIFSVFRLSTSHARYATWRRSRFAPRRSFSGSMRAAPRTSRR